MRDYPRVVLYGNELISFSRVIHLAHGFRETRIKCFENDDVTGIFFIRKVVIDERTTTLRHFIDFWNDVWCLFGV